MLKDAGCIYVIVGHSERRTDHGETDAIVYAKASAGHAAGLAPILCIGETLAERDAGETLAVVARQLEGSLPEGLKAPQIVVAYEPVWAIGTGLTATLEDIATMHAIIRGVIPVGARILYGGSVNPQNAAGILGLAEVDGALVGGASLNADSFWSIAESCPSPQPSPRTRAPRGAGG